MGLAELLTRWGSAEKLADKDVVFGLYAIWWARIGLAMQLAGALAVVADLLGEDKIKARAAVVADFTRRLVRFNDRHWKPVAMLIGVFALCAVIVFWLPPWLPPATTLKVKHGASLICMIIVLIVSVPVAIYGATIYLSLTADILSSSRFGPPVKAIAYGLPVIGTIFVILTS